MEEIFPHFPVLIYMSHAFDMSDMNEKFYSLLFSGTSKNINIHFSHHDMHPLFQKIATNCKDL